MVDREQRNGESVFDFYYRLEGELGEQLDELERLIIVWAKKSVETDDTEVAKMAPCVLMVLCKKHDIVKKELDEVIDAVSKMR